jgi:hypothetical protein
MQIRNLMKVMFLMVAIGCLGTYFFIDFHNSKLTKQEHAPRTLIYDEVHGPSYQKINDIIANQKKQNANNSEFINKLELAMLDLKVSKEIHQHVRSEVETISAYPLLVFWGMLSVIGFVLLRSTELKEKSIKQSYEKLLDHLEISSTQDYQKDKNNFDAKKLVKDLRSEKTEDV